MGGGASALFPDCCTLPLYYFTFTDDLVSIIMAITKLLSLDTRNTFIIFSDSISAIFSLNDQSTRNPLVSFLQRFLYLFHSQNESLIFCWVPSYVDIQGNEQVDGVPCHFATFKTTCPVYLPETLQAYFLPATDYNFIFIKDSSLGCRNAGLRILGAPNYFVSNPPRRIELFLVGWLAAWK